jgi:stage III sporulation protein AE
MKQELTVYANEATTPETSILDTTPPETTIPDSTIPDVNYTDIQNALNHALTTDQEFNFGNYVADLTTGEEDLSFQGIFHKIFSLFTDELTSNMQSLLRLLTIAVIAAVFTNFSHTFQNSQVAETGFYVTYLLMFVILATTFISATSIATTTVTKMLDFMKALVPTYCMTVAFCTGTATSIMYYEAILVLITVVNVVLIKVIIPMSNIYMMATLADNLSSEDLLSKLAELLATVIKWLLKTLLAVVIGIGTVQSLVAPAIDQVKRSTVMKATDMIPGVGGILSGVAETVLGAGVLLKNCIGVAGMIAIVIITAVPMIKLVIYVFIFKLLAAAIQPISDKRIVNCVSACSQATALLLQTVFVATVLFEIAITIVAISTMRTI